MSKQKKIALYIGLSIDMALTVFFFVISIIMIVKSVTMSAADIANAKGFIGYLQNHLGLYMGAFVVPLFVLLAINIIGLVMYVKSTEKAKEVKVSDLSDEQKEALKKQLLEELTKQ